MIKRREYIDYIKANEKRCKNDPQGLIDELKNKIGKEPYHSLKDYTKEKLDAFYHSDGWICASNIAWIREDKRCKDCNAEIDRVEMRLHHITNDNYYELYMDELESLCIPCHNKKLNSKNGHNKGKRQSTTMKEGKAMPNMSQEVRDYFEKPEGKVVLEEILSHKLTPCEAYDKYIYAEFGEKRPDTPVGHYGAMHKVLQEAGYRQDREKVVARKIAAKKSPTPKKAEQPNKGSNKPSAEELIDATVYLRRLGKI